MRASVTAHPAIEKERRMGYPEEWNALESRLITEFVDPAKGIGNAYIEMTGGGCHAIYLPLGNDGLLSVTDAYDPLSVDGESFGVWHSAWCNEEGQTVYRSDDRDHDALIRGIRAYLADGTRTGVEPNGQTWDAKRHFAECDTCRSWADDIEQVTWGETQ